MTAMEGEKNMEMITGIKNALDYIEANITEKLDYEQIARRAALSSYHFQRVFCRRSPLYRSR